jgi:hypothetical protein
VPVTLSEDATKMLLDQLADDRERSAKTFEAVIRIEGEIKRMSGDLQRGAERMSAQDGALVSLGARLSGIESRVPAWDATAAAARKGAGALLLLFLGSLWALVARTPAAGSDHRHEQAQPPAGESRPR